MERRGWCTVRAVTVASAATPARLFASAITAVTILAFLLVGQADGGTRAADAYLAPAGSCAAAADAAAPGAVQSRAIACLVNWARAQDSRSRLVQRPKLARASELKGQRVAACGQFSHTPCGIDVTAAVREAGYRYGVFGENLFVGTWGRISAQDVVAAWLASPPHRAIILSPQFRHLGAAPTRAPGLLGKSDAVVWTATFASPR
jgi:uncharacterized protein YkwD